MRGTASPLSASRAVTVFPAINTSPLTWPGAPGRFRLDGAAARKPLALALDSQTNNLSLAMAIEIEPGGRVLLFPGDAQISQWLAWSQLQWPSAGAASVAVTTAELLSRTILYKVGHHGAGRAPRASGGLDLMTSPDARQR